MKKILLIDDENDVFSQIREFFENRGFECSYANDGAQAIALLQEKQCDLIISDIGFPQRGQFLEYLSHEKITLPIIAISSHATEEWASRIFGSRMKGFFNKPLHEKQSEIVHSVMELLYPV